MTPVVANRPVPIDVRVVSATNLPTERLADPAVFRTDLLFRLNTVEIALPPLRSRREDVPLLLAHFLDLYARKYARPARTLPASVEAALVDEPTRRAAAGRRRLLHDRAGGTGVGLSLERRIMAARGGSITLERGARPWLQCRISCESWRKGRTYFRWPLTAIHLSGVRCVFRCITRSCPSAG